MKSLLLLALGLARTVVLGARIEAERIVVSVRPYKREQRRCPVCGRACDFYDMANRGAPGCGGRWTWRARPATWVRALQGALPEHGVRTEAVPWARHGGALHARLRGLGGVAGGPLHRLGGLRSSPASSGTAWAACRRVYAELEAARGPEVRRRAPHRHRRDVVQEGPQVRHGGRRPTARLPHLGARGHRQDVLNLFLDELTREQRRAIEVVTADGARRIRQLAVKRRCPNASGSWTPSTWSSG